MAFKMFIVFLSIFYITVTQGAAPSTQKPAVVASTNTKAGENPALSSCVLAKDINNACKLGKFLDVEIPSKNIKLGSTNCNQLFKKDDFVSPPKVKFAGAEPNKLYSLMLLDLDAPKTQPGKFFLHWIVSNIKGSDFKNGIQNVKPVTRYNKPQPPQNSGNHRYLFLAFEQSDPTKPIVLTDEAARSRANFDLPAYLAKQKPAVSLCGPVAGNQFMAAF